MRHRIIQTRIVCTGKGNRLRGCGSSATQIFTEDPYITRGHTMEGTVRFLSWSCPVCRALTDLGTVKSLASTFGLTSEALAELTDRKPPPPPRPGVEHELKCEVCRGAEGNLITVIGNVVSARGGGGLIGRALAATERVVDLPRFTAHPTCLTENISYTLDGGTRFDPCMTERQELAEVFESLGLKLPAAALRAPIRRDGATAELVAELSSTHDHHAEALRAAGELHAARVNAGLALALNALATGYRSRQWTPQLAKSFALGVGMVSEGRGETAAAAAPLQG